jgi:CRISPR-associated protein Csx3
MVFDPVLPVSLDGLTATAVLLGRPVRLTYHVTSRACGPRALTVNGRHLTNLGREPNPYRTGGLRVAGSVLAVLLTAPENHLEIEL